MKLFTLLQGALLTSIQGTAAIPVAPGAPAPGSSGGGGGSSCAAKDDYQKVKSGEPYALFPQLASGYECTSNLDDTCTVANSATYTQTVTKSVDGSASASLDLTKILGLSLGAGFSYSWSTSDATGTSAAVTCPKGQLHCGILVTSYVVKTTGQKRTVYVNEQGKEGCKEATKWQNFEVVAPQLVAKNAPKNQQAKMDFSACLDKCDGKQCNTADAKSLRSCSASPLDGPWFHIGTGGKPPKV